MTAACKEFALQQNKNTSVIFGTTTFRAKNTSSNKRKERFSASSNLKILMKNIKILQNNIIFEKFHKQVPKM